MRDPHVERLTYTVSPGRRRHDDPIQGDEGEYTYELVGKTLTIRMRAHCASANKAKSVVGPFLKGWEMKHHLKTGEPPLRFTFERAHIVDRAPLPPTPEVRDPSAPQELPLASGKVLMRGRGVTIRSAAEPSPPTPPGMFRISPCVESMWLRYERFRRDPDLILSMSNACVTRLIQEAGGSQRAAAQRYRVSRKILSKLGEFAANRGDEATARKFHGDSTLLALSAAERDWIEAVIRRLILRAGEVEADPNGDWPRITLQDFPLP